MHRETFEPRARRRARAAVCLLALAPAPNIGWADDEDEVGSLEQIVITATRTPTLIGDEPLRVEAVPAEEIEENLTVQPGNLTSLLNELPGVRVQSTAPGLGGAGLQLRGMPARDTLVITDGLPLLGAEPDAFGLLQTPPLDLKRVEVIKGAASALYGGSALGGVLNLVSQTADSEPGILANVTSRGGRDLVGFFTGKGSSRWSGTLTAGVHDQSREDIGGEGWADMPGYRRYTLRPRVWWNAGEARSLFLTAGITNEDREGGTLTVAAAGVLAINLQALVPAYARLGLGNASGYGLLMGAAGAGACLGGILQWRWPAGSIQRPLAAAAGLGLCLSALAATHDSTLAFVILVGFGVCSATVLCSASAAVQSFVPDSLRNAATALQVTIVLGINPLGSALTGWTLEHFGANRGSAALGLATLFAVAVLSLTSGGGRVAKCETAPNESPS